MPMEQSHVEYNFVLPLLLYIKLMGSIYFHQKRMSTKTTTYTSSRILTVLYILEKIYMYVYTNHFKCNQFKEIAKVRINQDNIQWLPCPCFDGTEKNATAETEGPTIKCTTP